MVDECGLFLWKCFCPSKIFHLRFQSVDYKSYWVTLRKKYLHLMLHISFLFIQSIMTSIHFFCNSEFTNFLLDLIKMWAIKASQKDIKLSDTVKSLNPVQKLICWMGPTFLSCNLIYHSVTLNTLNYFGHDCKYKIYFNWILLVAKNNSIYPIIVDSDIKKIIPISFAIILTSFISLNEI